MNILFTCAGRRVALLEAFRRAMAELDVTGRLIATDVTSASAAFQRADLGLITPKVGRIEYIPKLLDAVREHGVGLLVPLTDLDLRGLARHRAEFEEIGCAVMIGSEETVMLCRDKTRLNSLLGRAGLATIKTVTLKGFRANPFYPCFIKPIHGSGGVGTGVVGNPGELKAHLAAFGDVMLVQEYVPGQEFTIDVYRTRSGEVRAVVPRQRLLVRSGEVEKGVTVRDETLIECVTRLAGVLGDLWGVFCCQCRRSDSKEPRFFEINPRFGGGAPLAIAAGADLPLYLLQEVLGLQVTGKVGQFTDNLLMLRYDEAVFLNVPDAAALPGHQNPQFR